MLVTGRGGQQAAQLIAAITLATGPLSLLLALFRMGRIAQFLSKAMIRRRQSLARAGERGSDHSVTCTGNVLVGVVSLGVIFGLRFLAPAVPGGLVLVAGGLLASALFDLGAHGVALGGNVPRGLPAPGLPDLTLVKQHDATIGIAAVALLLTGFSQTAGDARAFGGRHRYRIDVNQESVAPGDGEHGRWRIPGNARLDQPLGQLAKRIGCSRPESSRVS